jgi:hypothetical protein
MGNCCAKSVDSKKCPPRFHMMHPDGRSYLMYQKCEDGSSVLVRPNGDSKVLNRYASKSDIVDIIKHHITAILAQPDMVVTFDCNVLRSTLPRCEYTMKHIDEIARIVKSYVNAIDACNCVVDNA